MDPVGSPNTILNNSIVGNYYLGIYTNTVTAPVLTSVVSGVVNGVTTVTINGNLTLPAGAYGVYTLEFFANTSSTNPQGQISLGTITVTTSGGTTTPFSFTYTSNAIPSGIFTATVTDPNGNTSEFSNALPAPPSPAPSPSPSPAPSPSPSPAPSPTTPPPSFVQAATTLFIDGAELFFDQLTGYGSQNLAGVNASIAFNSPYAGPFAELFVLAGEAAMAEQLSATQ